MVYRAHVEARSRELAKHADDDDDFQEAANDARVDLAPELEEVRARLKERRWEEDPGGSLLKVLTPVGAAATAILGAGVAVTVAAPIAAPLVFLALASSLQKTGNAMAGAPLAYAALAQRKFS